MDRIERVALLAGAGAFVVVLASSGGRDWLLDVARAAADWLLRTL